MARKKRLFERFFYPYLLLILVSLVAVFWFGSEAFHTFYLDQLTEELIARARLVRAHMPSALTPDLSGSVDSLCKTLGQESDMRITVILADGRVIGDSDEDPLDMDNHLSRPEIQVAMNEKSPGHSIRYSHTLDQTMTYVAIPLDPDSDSTPVIRTALPITDVNRALRAMNFRIMMGGLAVALFAAVISLLIARRIIRPLEDMKRGAERFARGELDTRLPVSHTEEMGTLAEAMNHMAAQLEKRIRTIVRQREEQMAVLSGMVEGVFAVDMLEKFLIMNHSAAELLGTDPETCKGENLGEIVKLAELRHFVRDVLTGDDSPVGNEITIYGEKERILQVHGAPLKNVHGQRRGAVIVLNDITQMIRLENTRRDFVANASHELKTPVTAIKGSVETLRDGALHDPEGANRFLEIISKQSDYLTAIIQDLLHLAKLERETETKIHAEPIVLQHLIDDCILNTEHLAHDRGQELIVESPDGLQVQGNFVLLQQAVVNLIENAIKYSPENKRIWIQAENCDEATKIYIRDEGPGIPEQHLPRLFERFYRVDKSRSRKLGGTGLGLAIVKHIVLAHNGKVSVDSVQGEGTTFTISIPDNMDEDDTVTPNV